MSVIDLLTNRMQTTDSIQQTTTVMANQQDNSKALLALLDGLSSGQTLLGKVMSCKGDQITIMTSDGVELTAKNNGNVETGKGQSILFEVRNVSREGLELRPLFQNMNQQLTAEVALKEAGLVVSERTLEMTAKAMEMAMPIDKQSLQTMARSVSSYPQTMVSDILNLQKMGIEVNKDTLLTYSGYVNTRHLMIQSVQEIAEAFTNEMTEYANSQDIQSQEPLNGLVDALKQIAQQSLDSPSSINEQSIDIPAQTKQDANLELSSDGSKESRPVKVTDERVDNAKNLLNLLGELKECIDSKDPVAICKMVQSKEVKAAINQFLMTQWSLDETQISDKYEVKHLYERLAEETHAMQQVLSDSVSKEGQVYKSVQSLQKNLDFMNQMNQYIPYVQIPFHKDDSRCNSELYVYTRNKSLVGKNQEISAFLHLDMDHLGPTDVYVKLKNQNVQTKFLLKNEEMMSFIQSNIEQLTKRLKDRGYNMEAQFECKEEDVPAILQVLSDTSEHLLIGNTSFDARV